MNTKILQNTLLFFSSLSLCGCFGESVLNRVKTSDSDYHQKNNRINDVNDANNKPEEQKETLVSSISYEDNQKNNKIKLADIENKTILTELIKNYNNKFFAIENELHFYNDLVQFDIFYPYDRDTPVLEEQIKLYIKELHDTLQLLRSCLSNNNSLSKDKTIINVLNEVKEKRSNQKKFWHSKEMGLKIYFNVGSSCYTSFQYTKNHMWISCSLNQMDYYNKDYDKIISDIHESLKTVLKNKTQIETYNDLAKEYLKEQTKNEEKIAKEIAENYNKILTENINGYDETIRICNNFIIAFNNKDAYAINKLIGMILFLRAAKSRDEYSIKLKKLKIQKNIKTENEYANDLLDFAFKCLTNNLFDIIDILSNTVLKIKTARLTEKVEIINHAQEFALIHLDIIKDLYQTLAQIFEAFEANDLNASAALMYANALMYIKEIRLIEKLDKNKFKDEIANTKTKALECYPRNKMLSEIKTYPRNLLTIDIQQEKINRAEFSPNVLLKEKLQKITKIKKTEISLTENKLDISNLNNSQLKDFLQNAIRDFYK